MNYAIDQINDTIVLLENIQTGEKREVNISLLPENIKEGSTLILKDGIYALNNVEEEKRRQRIQEKLNRLKRLKNKE